MSRALRRIREDERFPGFASLDGIAVPLELSDELLPRLTNLELRALLYLLPHVRREGDKAGEIPLDQLLERITAPPVGRHPGLSRVSFLRACAGLIRKGVLLSDGPLIDPRVTDFRSSRLRLRTRGGAADPMVAPAAARQRRSRVVREVGAPLPLIQDLVQLGLSRRQARELLEACSIEDIERQMVLLPFRGSKTPVETLLRASREDWPTPPEASPLLAVQPAAGRSGRHALGRIEAHLAAVSPSQRNALMRQAVDRVRALGGTYFTDGRVPHRLRLAFARWLLAEQLGITPGRSRA